MTDLAAVLAAVPFGITLHDSEGVCVAANRRAGGLLGVEPEALLGSDPWGPAPGHRCQDGAEVRESPHPVRQALTRGEVLYAIELEPALGDAPTRVTVDFAPVVDRDMVVAAIREPRSVPEPPLAFDEFTRRMQPALDRESVAVWLKDVEGRYLFVSRGFGRALGKRRRDIIGARDADFLPEELAAQCEESDRVALMARDAIEIDEVHASAQGSERVYRTIKIPVLDDEGHPVALAGASMEITDLRARAPAAHVVHRVIVCDDDPIVRRATRRLIDTDPTCKVVAEAGSGEELLELIGSSNPDVVVVDVEMPGMSGLEALATIRRTHAEIRVVTYSSDPAYLARALELGADAFVVKTAAQAELISAISGHGG